MWLCSPLYRIVSKFSPIRLGNKKVSRPVSQVPSPTCSVFDEYVLPPAAVKSESDILVAAIEVFCDCKYLECRDYRRRSRVISRSEECTMRWRRIDRNVGRQLSTEKPRPLVNCNLNCLCDDKLKYRRRCSSGVC